MKNKIRKRKFKVAYYYANPTNEEGYCSFLGKRYNCCTNHYWRKAYRD